MTRPLLIAAAVAAQLGETRELWVLEDSDYGDDGSYA